MAGFYIHIPFCRQACIYCNFHFSTQLKRLQPVMTAISQEIALRKDYLQGESIESIYLGGGTPSLLSGAEIEKLLNEVQNHYQLASGLEITLEANPDDLSLEKLQGFKKAGINRLSIGIQSFDDDDLRYLHRAHNSRQAVDSVIHAQKVGIENISIDLIYGIPGQKDETWQKNLERLAALNIPHFSAYSLTIEPRTALEKMIQKNISKPVDEQQTIQYFMLLHQWAEAQGYIPYEISNFAWPSHLARHNSGYWNDMKYIGIGPSAHSYNGDSRQWNIANNALYMQNIQLGKGFFEKEYLSISQKYNEHIMTRLRTWQGVIPREIEENFGKRYKDYFLKNVEKYSALIKIADECFILNLSGRLLADKIIADLMWI